jgi:hypothetical protein
LSVEPLEDRTVPAAAADTLYVGDAGATQQGPGAPVPNDDTIWRFDANTRQSHGVFADTGLEGITGLIFRDRNHLYAVNQTAVFGVPNPGGVLRYDAHAGASLSDPPDYLISPADADAPWDPRGVVMKDGVLYVADRQTADGNTVSGRLAMYDATDGTFLGNLVPEGFEIRFDKDGNPDPAGAYKRQFNPRGVVIGPDGHLYVSVLDQSARVADHPALPEQPGYVIKIDPASGDWSMVAANDGDGLNEAGEIKDLHRPEGLVFGPDGRLYVTSFRADTSDIDRILILNGTTGALEDTINMVTTAEFTAGERAAAQTILFGPGGRLFAPITVGSPKFAGSVRRYDVSTKAFVEFVRPYDKGGPLIQPVYMTFGQTNPATLAYEPLPAVERIQVNDGGVQRSLVKSVTVAFTTRVTLDAGAFQLLRNGKPADATVNVALAQVDGKTVATLTFSGKSVVGGSLRDGQYRLKLDAAKVHNPADNPMAADAELSLHRRFGDADGDGDVDNSDRAAFNASYKTKAADPAYRWYFEFDQDGDIDGADSREFGKRLNRP